MNPIYQQAESIRRNWGEEAAQRYLSLYRVQAPPKPLRTERWVSNTVHQPKRFTPTQADTIRSQIQGGQTYEQVAKEWNCCKGTIGNVVHRRGAYREAVNYAQTWK
jgi:hypothetical protein